LDSSSGIALLIIILTILLKIAVGVVIVVRAVYDPGNNKSCLPLAKTYPLGLLSSASTLNTPKLITIITKQYPPHGLSALYLRGLPLSIILNYYMAKLAT